jgi:hypothetical protein
MKRLRWTFLAALAAALVTAQWAAASTESIE